MEAAQARNAAMKQARRESVRRYRAEEDAMRGVMEESVGLLRQIRRTSEDLADRIEEARRR